MPVLPDMAGETGELMRKKSGGGRAGSELLESRLFFANTAFPNPIIATVDGAQRLVSVDVDNDGWLDVVCVNRGQSCYVLLSNHDRTFRQLTMEIPGVWGVAAGDVNRDGKVDLVTVNYSSGNLQVSMGNGDGTFAQPAIYNGTDSTQGSSSIVTGDFTGDGYIDLAVSARSVIRVLPNRGDGTFRDTVATGRIDVTLPSGGLDAFSADFNRDGRPDLLAASTNVATVRFATGNGAFSAAVSYPWGVSVGGTVIDDFDGDGAADVATSSYTDQKISILFNRGDGTFTAPAFVSSPIHSGLNTVDATGDGLPELVTYSTSTSTSSRPDGLSVFRNLGNRAFDSAVQVPTAHPIYALTPGDLDKDGWKDLAIGSGDGLDEYVSAYFNARGTIAPVPTSTQGTQAKTDPAVADFDGDGILDVAYAGYGEGSGAWVMKGSGSGSYTLAARLNFFATNTLPTGIAAADFTSDGRPDIVVSVERDSTATTKQSVLFYRNNGDGTFAAPVGYHGGAYPYTMRTADLNGDGRTDVITSADPAGVHVMMNTGSGLSAATLFSTPNYARSFQIVDIDTDGVWDLVTLSGSLSLTLSVFRNRGNGTFDPALTYATPSGTEYLVCGDFDRDGKPDVVTSGANGGVVSALYRNSGSGGLGAPITFGRRSSRGAVADVNADGFADLVQIHGGDNVDVYVSSASPDVLTFEGTYPTHSQSVGVAITDVNGDGLGDIVTTYDAGVSVLPGRGAQAPRYATVTNGSLQIDLAAAGIGNVAVTISPDVTRLVASAGEMVVPTSSFSSLSFAGTASSDSVTVSAAIAKRLSYSGVAGEDHLTLSGSARTRLAALGPSLNVTVGPGGAAEFTQSVALRGLSIAQNASAQFATNTGAFLKTSSLAIDNVGRLDLNDSDLLVTNTLRATIESYIRTAYNFGGWDGPGGIFSSTAKNNPNGNTTLGLLSGQEFNDNNGGLFNGVAVNNSDVLVKYTYFGDVDFNGSVDVSDYNLIDFGFANHLSGWANGDADWSGGATDVSDYNVIDFAFATQMGIL